MVAYPLTLTVLLRRAYQFFPDKAIISRRRDGLFRYHYRAYYARVCRLAAALRQLGVRPGDRVATFAWNHHRHLELYFAVPVIGAVLHTVNIRLFPAEIAYILNHAADRCLFVDDTLWPVIEPLRGQLRHLEHVVVMSDDRGLLAGQSPELLDYEGLVDGAAPLDELPALDEQQPAAMCYTSGTTGSPKGILYSHRALFLHTFAACLADGHAISERDTVLHVVPMFHANAWGIPFAAAMAGARQVLAGERPTAPVIADLIEGEGVTYVGMVPTLASDLLQYLEKHPRDLGSLRALVLGGAPPSPALLRSLQEDHGVPVYQGWGMTELAPMGTFCRLRSYMDAWPTEQRYAQQVKQGPLLPGLEWKLVNDAGQELPWDGSSVGELVVRGPWVTDGYYGQESAESFDNGWFRTGDVGTIDRHGFLEIVDRKKDLIKSGGEWISSVELERRILSHPMVQEAAVVGIPHPRWQERPLACVVPKPDGAGQFTPSELLQFLSGQVARWWLPDRVVFLRELPRTSVGKVDKRRLREQFRHPGEAPGL